MGDPGRKREQGVELGGQANLAIYAPSSVGPANSTLIATPSPTTHVTLKPRVQIVISAARAASLRRIEGSSANSMAAAIAEMTVKMTKNLA